MIRRLAWRRFHDWGDVDSPVRLAAGRWCNVASRSDWRLWCAKRRYRVDIRGFRVIEPSGVPAASAKARIGSHHSSAVAFGTPCREFVGCRNRCDGWSLGCRLVELRNGWSRWRGSQDGSRPVCLGAMAAACAEAPIIVAKEPRARALGASTIVHRRLLLLAVRTGGVPASRAVGSRRLTKELRTSALQTGRGTVGRVCVPASRAERGICVPEESSAGAGRARRIDQCIHATAGRAAVRSGCRTEPQTRVVAGRSWVPLDAKRAVHVPCRVCVQQYGRRR